MNAVLQAWPAAAACAAAALAAAATAALLVRLAPARLKDDGAGERARKLQTSAVPLVLGPALAAGCAAAWIVSSPLDGGAAPVPRLLAALAAAFLLGLADDLAPAGLGPAVKFAGQCLVALLYAAEPAAAADEAVLRFAAALVALNAANTFDNADGALLACCGAPLLAAGVPAGAAAAALLPWNLARGGARAYMGDAGSHSLGLLLLLVHPLAWTLLCLPAVDLALVALERCRHGQPPWRGDRRHLAHRLQRRGWSRLAVAGALCLCALPPWVGALAAGETGLVAGAAACVCLCLWAWRLGRPQPA